MRWWEVVIVAVLCLGAIAFFALAAAWQSTEQFKVSQRMKADARRARRELYEEQRERVRRQLRAEQPSAESWRRAFRPDE